MRHQIHANIRHYIYFLKLQGNYLRQVNGVNSGDNVLFEVRLSVCLSVCVCSTDHSITPRFKTVKATDFNLTRMFPLGTVQT